MTCLQREGSQNKMNRRRKQIEQRSSSTVTKILSKDTVGLAVRIHIGRHASAEIKAALKGLNLTRKYDAVFVKLDEENIRKTLFQHSSILFFARHFFVPCRLQAN